MFIDTNTSREDLEMAIIDDRDLYYSLDETKFLNGDYSTAELLVAIQTWIEAGNECAA